MSGLHRFGDEAATIGRLLTRYTDLEIDLLHCVQVATGDFDTTFKAMYRVRGETKRIATAETLGLPAYAALGLDAEFKAALDAVRFCLSIRNQYAHHNFWDDNTDQWAMGDLETIAKQPGPFKDLSEVHPYHLTNTLLLEQEAYFRETDDALTWVNYEGRFKRGEMPGGNMARKPRFPARPVLYLP